MSDTLIERGLKINLEIFGKSGTMVGEVLAGKVAEVENDKQIIVLLRGKLPVKLYYYEIEKVKASFTHKLHGFLKFNGTITDRETSNLGLYLHIKIDDDLDSIQKRQHFRPIAFLKAEYRIVEKNEDGNLVSDEDTPYKPATTKNISYTGMGIYMDEDKDVGNGTLLDMIIWLNKDTSIKSLCKVVWIKKDTFGENISYELGLTIEDMDKRCASVLKQFITRSTFISSLYWGETPFKK